MAKNQSNAKLPSRIASVMLAKLYLQQNHPEQARDMLASLLAENPFHGPALVLQHRLGKDAPPLLTAHPHGNALRIQWVRVPLEQSMQPLQIIAIVFAKSTYRSIYVTSAPCIASQGECFLACGKNPGAASLCIAAFASPSSSPPFFWPIAVCEPIVWA